MFGVTTCTINAKFKYSRNFKTKAGTRHASFSLCNIMFKIWVRLIFCQCKFIFSLGLRKKKENVSYLIWLTSVQVNRPPPYTSYVPGTWIGTLDTEKSGPTASPSPGPLTHQERRIYSVLWVILRGRCLTWILTGIYVEHSGLWIWLK